MTSATEPVIASASEARLQLIELAPDGIFVTREGKIVYVNRAGAAMLGLATGNVVDLPLADFLTPHELAAGTARLGSVQPDRLLPARIYDVRRRDGQIVTVEATSLAIEWDGGPAALTFSRDITERLRLEQALSRASSRGTRRACRRGRTRISKPLAFLPSFVSSAYFTRRTTGCSRLSRCSTRCEEGSNGSPRSRAI
jgi:PAS domain S-box-containing protein